MTIEELLRSLIDRIDNIEKVETIEFPSNAQSVHNQMTYTPTNFPMTNNNKISPSIDTMNKLVHLTSNLIVPENQLNGYNINLTDSNGVFEIGDTVSQGSAVAIVRYSNTSFIRVTDVGFGPMQANNTTIVKSNNNNVNAIISSINYFSDVYENNNHHIQVLTVFLLFLLV